MKVYLFDLLAYDQHFEQAKADRYLPYPLPKSYSDRETTARSYEQHLEAWREMDRLGYDGVGLNEHHTTPHGLINSPNLMAAVAAQHTKNLKFLLLGNLVPLNDPLRVAEELAMADNLSRGRIISGFARGVPREYGVFGVPMADSRARFEEACDIIMKAWTEEVFSYEGRFWSYKDVSIWPRTYQEPHPPVWIPFTGSKETIQWAAARNLPAVVLDIAPGLTEDIVGYYSRALAGAGHKITPDHLCLFADCFVADSPEAALEEYGPYYLYFRHCLFTHGSVTEEGGSRDQTGYVASASYDYIRPENRAFVSHDRSGSKNLEIANVKARIDAGRLAFGTPKQVTEYLIEAAESAGTESLLLSVNSGAVPHKMFMEQIRRFGTEVLPKLQAHKVKRVPAAEKVSA